MLKPHDREHKQFSPNKTKLYDHGLKNRRKHGKNLCTNGCDYADMWMNCKELAGQWRDWLCNNKQSIEGRERFRNCKATCTCDPKTTLAN